MIKIGADLILQDIVIRQKPTKAFFNKLQKALNKKVKMMTRDALAAWDDEVTGNHDDTEKLSDLRVKALAVIQTGINDLRGPCRDMTWITLPKDGMDLKNKENRLFTIYLAGGMSWGDSPGESYEELYKLNMLFPDYRYLDEVFDDDKQWPKCRVCGRTIYDDDARDCCDKCLIETGKRLAKLKLGGKK